MIRYLGAWGRTIFSLKPSLGLEGDRIILRTPDGHVEIGYTELQVIIALAKIFDITAPDELIAVVKNRLANE
jgi:hypothetical protein